MEKINGFLSNLIIITVIIVLGFFAGTFLHTYLEFFGKPEVVHDTIVEIKYITYRDTIYKYKLVPYEVKLPNDTIYIPTDCDSLKTLYIDMYTKFHTEKYFKESYKIDTIGEGCIRTGIKENRILYQAFSYDIKIPEKTTTITNTVFQDALYLGVFLGKETISPTLTYNKNNFNYSIGYNISNNSINFGVGYNLKKLW